jgi:hypothetical protein
MAKPTQKKPAAKKAASAMRQAMREEDERPAQTPQGGGRPRQGGRAGAPAGRQQCRPGA